MTRSGRKLAAIAAAALVTAAVPAMAAPDANARGEAELAQAIAGRTAGAPVDCINYRRVAETRIIDHLAILYRMNDGTLFVNRPRSGLAFLNRDDIVVTEPTASRLCSVDIVRLLEGSSRFPRGSVGLDRFVPYGRVGR